MSHVYHGPAWPEHLHPTAARALEQSCQRCEEPITDKDSSIVMGCSHALHHECFMRGVLGSIGHQMGRCGCHGGQLEDPFEMTQRQAAKAALDYFQATANSQQFYRRPPPAAQA